MFLQISGRVLRGDGYGRKIGFPTANLDRRQYVRLLKKPRLGIYAGSAIVNGRAYKAGIVVGPIDKKGLPKIEAHLVGFKGNLYDKEMMLNLVSYLRPFSPYANERALVSQIRKDIVQVKRLIKL